VSAFNSFSGYYVYKTDTSPPDIPLLNGDPESDSLNDTITLNISTQKPRGTTDNRLLYILISDKNNTRDSNKFEKFGLKNVQIAVNCTLELSQHSLKITIGNANAYQFDNCNQTNNLPLEPATFYTITVLLLHTFQNKSSHNIYTFMYKTLDTRHKTVDTRHTTVDTRHTTVDTRHTTVDTRHTTVDTRHTTVGTRHTTVDTRHTTVDTRHKTADTRHKTVDTRHKTLNTSEQVYLDNPIHFQKSFFGLLFLALLILPVIGYLYV
jgi:hypothetical protein